MTGGFVYHRNNRDNRDYIVEIVQNAQTSPGISKIRAVTQTQVKDHQRTLV